MKKLILVPLIVFATSCAKKTESNNPDPQANDQGNVVSSTYGVECTSKIMTEEKVEGGVLKEERNLHAKYGNTTVKEKAKPDEIKSKVLGDVESVTKTTHANGQTETKEVRYTTTKESLSAVTSLGASKYKEVIQIKYKNVAKDGYDFGKDQHNNIIRVKEKSYTDESVYKFQNSVWEEISAKRDGKELPATPGRYLSEERREGVYSIRTESLIDPVKDTTNANLTIVSDVKVCRVKEITLN